MLGKFHIKPRQITNFKISLNNLNNKNGQKLLKNNITSK